jgi:acetyl-CoA C-acetyltransferase
MARGDTAYIAGAYEHPTREAPDKSEMQLHAEAARGALEDANMELDDVDGYATAGAPHDRHSIQPLVMGDYLGLENVSFLDTTETGGAAYISHIGHAAAAIERGVCDVALVTFAERPKSSGVATGTETIDPETMPTSFEKIHGVTVIQLYAMAAQRHMHEFDTTEEQLAEIRVAASEHAAHNKNAVHQDPVTVRDVVESRMVADPLHLLDCCLITDGGGALVVVSESVKEKIDRESVAVLGVAEAMKYPDHGNVDLTHMAAQRSGEQAFAQAGISRDEIDYAGIYDSFTITVLETIEDLGFCDKGAGGEFVEGGTLRAPHGELPFNTKGGSLCSNHPDRGGMTKVIETVNQLRGESNPAVQVPDTEFALAHGTGGGGMERHTSVTAILGGERR